MNSHEARTKAQLANSLACYLDAATMCGINKYREPTPVVCAPYDEITQKHNITITVQAVNNDGVDQMCLTINHDGWIKEAWMAAWDDNTDIDAAAIVVLDILYPLLQDLGSPHVYERLAHHS